MGDHVTKHAWGYGCGRCPACELRAKGYEEWRAS
jgi:7-cyano-7-deazaguanine synthase